MYTLKKRTKASVFMHNVHIVAPYLRVDILKFGNQSANRCTNAISSLFPEIRKYFNKEIIVKDVTSIVQLTKFMRKTRMTVV